MYYINNRFTLYQVFSIILFSIGITVVSHAQDSIPPSPKPEPATQPQTPPTSTNISENQETTNNSEATETLNAPTENPQTTTPPPVAPTNTQTRTQNNVTTTNNNSTNNNSSIRNTTTSSVNTNSSTTEPVNVEEINDGEPNPFALFSKGKKIYHSNRITLLPNKLVKGKRVVQPQPEPKQELVQEQLEEVEEPEQESVVRTPVDTSDVALNTKNPFGVTGTFNPKGKTYQSRKIAFNPTAGAGTKASKKEQERRLIFDTSKVNTLGTLKFGLLLSILGLLAILMSGFRDEVNDMYKAFMSNNMMVLLLRDKGHLIHIPYVLSYAILALSGGTFIYLLAGYLGMPIAETPFQSLSLCILGVISVFLFKHLILSILGWIFPFRKEVKLYSFSLGIFNSILGIALVPFIAFQAFAPTNLQRPILYIGFALLGIFLIFRLIRYFGIANKFLAFHKFHFFIYLCTVEISPMMILFKYISS